MGSYTPNRREHAYEHTPLRSLSALTNPPEDWVMAVLKAYLDDSGHAADKRHTYLTIAGYSQVVGDGDYFERNWAEALRAFEVPYLHMKEFQKPDSVYEHLKTDPERMALFFKQLVSAIKGGLGHSVSCSVRLPDLREFNKAHNLRLDPYSVAIYGCFINFAKVSQPEYRDKLEIVFDKFERAMSRAEKGRDYYHSDSRSSAVKSVCFSISFLQDEAGHKDIYQLQAADFLAYEIQKNLEDSKDFLPSREARKDISLLQGEYEDFAQKHLQASGKPPRERKSYLALMAGKAGQKSSVITRDDLERLIESHPSGWTKSH